MIRPMKKKATSKSRAIRKFDESREEPELATVTLPVDMPMTAELDAACGTLVIEAPVLASSMSSLPFLLRLQFTPEAASSFIHALSVVEEEFRFCDRLSPARRGSH